MLQEGDVIELREGHTVYTNIPKTYVFENAPGDFSLVNTSIKIEKHHMWLAGKYIVIKITTENDDIRKIWCINANNKNISVSFHENCNQYTACISGLSPISRAVLEWKLQQ